MDLGPLIFSRQLQVTQLTLDQPQIDLLQSAAGDWNFSSLGGKSAAQAAAGRVAPPSDGLDLSVKLVKITNGRSDVRPTEQQREGPHARKRQRGATRFLHQPPCSRSAFPAKLAGGGDIQLNGTAGPINPTDAAQTPAKVKVKLSGFDLAAPA